MDGHTQRKSALLRNFTASISQDAIAQLTEQQTADICRALVSARVLADETLTAPSRRAEAAQAIDIWFSALSKGLQTVPQVTHQARLTQLLAASVTICDLPRLLLHYQPWLTLLLDQLKAQRDQLLQRIQPENNAQQGAAAAPQDQQQSKKRPRPVPQGPVSTHEVAVFGKAIAATCRAVSCVFNRLGDVMEVSGVRREASALASRACGLLLPLLPPHTPSPPHTALLASLQLIHRLVDVAPTSLRNHQTALETSLAATLVMSSGSGASGDGAAVRSAAAAALSVLPRVSGDVSVYSEQFRRLLLSIHDAVDVLCMGLDDSAAAAACRAPLTIAAGAAAGAAAAAAAQPLLPLGAVLGAGTEGEGRGAQGAVQGHRRVDGASVRHASEVVRGGMEVVQGMLTAPFPVPVPLPCDRDVLSSGRTPPSTTGFTQLQLALPSLHVQTLSLLHTLVTAAGTAMLPLHAALGRLLAEQLRVIKALGPGAQAAVPAAQRAALYRLAAAGCAAPGGGLVVAQRLAEDGVGAVQVELYGWLPESKAAGRAAGAKGRAAGLPGGSAGLLLHGGLPGDKPASKKAKLSEAAEVAAGAEAAAAAAAAAAGPAGCYAAGSAALKAATAALGLLAAVVDAAGSLLPAATRATADTVAYHLAVTASDAAVRAAQEPGLTQGAHAAGLQRVRADALRCLLSTLLTPLPTRPPYLSQALSLFKQGCTARCAEVAGVCKEACGSLEALLHPRATPITGVRHAYAGVEDVAPLPAPRLWSPLLASHTQPPAAQPAVNPAAQPAVPNGLAPHPTHADVAAAAKAATAAAAPVTIATAHKGQAQQPAAVASAPSDITRNGLASVGTKANGPAGGGGANKVAEPVAREAAANGTAGVGEVERVTRDSDTVRTAPALVHKTQTLQPEPTAMDVDKPQDGRTAPQRRAVQPAAVAGAQPAAAAGSGAAAAPQPVAEQAITRPSHAVQSSVFGDESSDSEGSLPDIDMGVGGGGEGSEGSEGESSGDEGESSVDN